MNAQSISEIPILPNFTIQAPSTIVPNILFLTEALAELQADHPIWFEQHRTRIYSAANDVTNGAVHPTSDPQKFMVASHSRPDVTHLVDRQARKCRCEWGYNGKLCRHRIAVHLALRGFDLQETYERDQQEREQARKRSELFENPKGAWDNVNGQIIHICPDGFSGANVFGVGSDMWCGRCTENMPNTVLTREQKAAYNYQTQEAGAAMINLRTPAEQTEFENVLTEGGAAVVPPDTVISWTLIRSEIEGLIVQAQEDEYCASFVPDEFDAATAEAAAKARQRVLIQLLDTLAETAVELMQDAHDDAIAEMGGRLPR